MIGGLAAESDVPSGEAEVGAAVQGGVGFVEDVEPVELEREVKTAVELLGGSCELGVASAHGEVEVPGIGFWIGHAA